MLLIALLIVLHWPEPANIVSPKSGAVAAALAWQNGCCTDETMILVAPWPDDPYEAPVPLYSGPAIESIDLPSMKPGLYNWMVVSVNGEGWSESEVWEFQIAP